MILKGSQRSGAKQLARHLTNGEENEHVEVHEVRGFVSENLKQALEEIYAISRGTKCRQPMFSLSLSPPQDQDVPIEAFEKAIEKIEKKLGLENQPRVIVFHEKKGRRHAHCVWSRINTQTMTAINLPHYKFKLRDVSRQLYLEHDWKMPNGLADTQQKNPLNFTLAEWQQANRRGEDPAAIKMIFQRCWRMTKTDKAFASELERNGYYLARGDRRGFVAVDWRGEVYSLTKWIGVRSKELKTRLGDGKSLSNVIEVKARLAKQMTKKLQGFVHKTDSKHKTISEKMVDDRTKMVERHREERKALQAAQEKRAKEEDKQRSARLPRGLRVVWYFVTGKYHAIRKQNETEAARCLARDRGEKQQIILRQLKERRKLQQQMKVWLERHWQETLLFKQDIAYYLGMDMVKNLRDRAQATVCMPNESDPMRPSFERRPREASRDLEI